MSFSLHFDPLDTPTLVPTTNPFDNIMDSALVTPTRFLNDLASEFRFTPGIMTKYAAGDYNPFEHQFASETPSVAPAAQPSDGAPAPTPSSPRQAPSTAFPPSPSITPQTSLKTSFSDKRRSSLSLADAKHVPVIKTDHLQSPVSPDYTPDGYSHSLKQSPTTQDSWPPYQYADPTLLQPPRYEDGSMSPASPNYTRDRRDSFQSVGSMSSMGDYNGDVSPMREKSGNGGSGRSSGGAKRKAAAAGLEDPEEEEKRRKFLERNRLAASKCRQKKKAWMQELERRSSEISSKNRHLQMIVNQLKEEIILLKNQLLLHRNCDCNVIQQYIQTSSQFSQQLHRDSINVPPTIQHITTSY